MRIVVFFFFFNLTAVPEKNSEKEFHQAPLPSDTISDGSDSPERGTGSARFAGYGRPAVENVEGLGGTVQV